jgi:hypothetical protein
MMLRMNPQELQRFLCHVSMNDQGCWVWEGCTDDRGYGQFKWRGKKQWAHRLAYATFNGPIVACTEIHHALWCLNPSCVNPDHLIQVTPGENRADANIRNGFRGNQHVDRDPVSERG